MEIKERIRKIYEVLPKLNCGSCGYNHCAQYAKAVAEGRASPYLCIGGPLVAYKISEITGTKVSTLTYQFYGMPTTRRTGIPVSTVSLKEEVRELNQRVGDILTRIESLRG